MLKSEYMGGVHRHTNSPADTVCIVDAADLDRWFRKYLSEFAACGRGECEAPSLLAYYGVPLLFSTDDGVVALTTGDEVSAMAQRQVDGMRAADYDHSDILEFEISGLNSVSALLPGDVLASASRWERDRSTHSHVSSDKRI